ncbi:unnamed protein product, partial [Brassica rapa subsp. trilocularis]
YALNRCQRSTTSKCYELVGVSTQWDGKQCRFSYRTVTFRNCTNGGTNLSKSIT